MGFAELHAMAAEDMMTYAADDGYYQPVDGPLKPCRVSIAITHADGGPRGLTDGVKLIATLMVRDVGAYQRDALVIDAMGVSYRVAAQVFDDGVIRKVLVAKQS